MAKLYANNHPLNYISYVETSTGLLNFESVCKSAKNNEKHFNNIKHSGCVFGSDDFCADMGIERDINALLYARQKIATVCRAFGIDAIDAVYIDFKDRDGLIEQSLQGKGFGFSGKQLIHPTQIEPVNKAFSPSEDKIEWATGLILEFDLAEKDGRGAFTYRGQMIDRPLLLQARNVLKIADRSQK